MDIQYCEFLLVDILYKGILKNVEFLSLFYLNKIFWKNQKLN